MPYGDRTGPQGLGPRTGRGAGYCSGFSGPGSMNPVPGRGFFGFGRGCGWRNCYRATGFPGRAKGGYGFSRFAAGFTAEEEMDGLRDEAEYLKQQLNDIQNRMSTLEKSRAKQDE